MADREYSAMNGALWTLFWEAGCYVVAGVVISVLPRKWVGPAALVGFSSVTAVSLALHFAGQPGPVVFDRPLQMFGAFLAGACLTLYAHRIPTFTATVLSAAALVVVGVTGTAAPLSAFPFTLLLISASTWLPLHRVGSRRDISYGLYIYGWPMEQLLVVLGLHSVVPPLVFAVIAVAVTIPLALASFVLVEAPALRWAKGRTARPSETTAPSARDSLQTPESSRAARQ